ncbi:MAG: arsenic efflux protein [Clostridia bacterium]|nr:arsenic efflux protein [Clostridia bacterium]
MGQVFLDSFLDTLKLLPFVLIIYILIELLEHKTSFTENHKLLQGHLAPLLGAATGIIPQCGFSVMAAKLYDKKLIRTGTLLAVFLATSDEALIILLSSIDRAYVVIPLIVIKLAVAIGIGYLVNAMFRKEPQVEHVEGEISAYSCDHDHEEEKPIKTYFVRPLLHTLEVGAYLFIVTLVFGIIIYYVGEDSIAEWFVGGAYLQPLICGAIGLIPNCASSVIITGAYLNGGVLFGSMVAGLCVNAGMGMVILFKNTRAVKRNLAILVAMYVIGVAVGILINSILVATGWYVAL